MLVFHNERGDVLSTMTLGQNAGHPVPEGCIEVPQRSLGDLFDWQVIDGELVRRTVLTADQRSLILEKIKAARGAARARFITVLPGQDMVYLAKEAEARAWLADPAPDLADYPMIAAEIPTTGQDGDQVAQVWANMAGLWRLASTIIESATLAADGIVRAAETVAEAEAALDEMAAALAALG